MGSFYAFLCKWIIHGHKNLPVCRLSVSLPVFLFISTCWTGLNQLWRNGFLGQAFLISSQITSSLVNLKTKRGPQKRMVYASPSTSTNYIQARVSTYCMELTNQLTDFFKETGGFDLGCCKKKRKGKLYQWWWC